MPAIILDRVVASTMSVTILTLELVRQPGKTT